MYLFLLWLLFWISIAWIGKMDRTNKKLSFDNFQQGIKEFTIKVTMITSIQHSTWGGEHESSDSIEGVYQLLLDSSLDGWKILLKINCHCSLTSKSFSFLLAHSYLFFLVKNHSNVIWITLWLWDSTNSCWG